MKNTKSSDSSPQRNVTRQLLVAFTSEDAALSRSKIFAKYGAQELERVGSTPLYLIEVPGDTDLKDVQKKIAAEKGVKYAEPNFQFKIMKPEQE